MSTGLRWPTAASASWTTATWPSLSRPRGTTVHPHLVFEPLELIGRLAALTPPPRLHLIDQSRRRVDHASTHTGRAPAAALAGKGDRPTLPTVFAAKPHESMGQDAALQVGAQLLLDVPRQLVPGRASALHEGLQMLCQNPVQRMLFWLVAAIRTRLSMRTGDRHGAGRAATRGPLGEESTFGSAITCLWSTKLTGLPERGAKGKDVNPGYRAQGLLGRNGDGGRLGMLPLTPTTVYDPSRGRDFPGLVTGIADIGRPVGRAEATGTTIGPLLPLSRSLSSY
jgi:hypothetical protein